MNKRNFFREVTIRTQEAEDRLDLEALQFLSEVREFIQEGRGVWTTYRRFDEFTSVCYKPVASLAKVLGLTLSSARDLIAQQSNRLYETVGEDFFDLVEERRFDAARERMGSVTFEDSLDVVISDLWIEIGKRVGPNDPQLSLQTYDPEGDVEEVEVLAALSKFRLRELLETVSAPKLAYMIGILDGRFGEPADRTHLIKRIREGV